jgi:hypothetical protein
VSFVLVASTPPANLGLVSLKVVPTAITLTPSTGTATTFSINSGNGYSFDLVRLQSDSAFVGTVPKVPTGTYTTIAVTFSGAEIAFLNGTGAAITNLNPQCLAGEVCVAAFPGPFTSTITTSQAIGANTGLGIDVNLANAVSVTGSTLSVNFVNSGTASVVSAFALPRGTSSNLAAGQLDLIEDFTGIATVSGSTVTITPPPAVNRPPITATTASTTVYDVDPSGTLCSGAATLAACFPTGNEAASMDAILNSDGTFKVQEVEPLLASPVVDTVEGTVVSIKQTSTAQFNMIVTDIIPAASGSLIASLGIGAPLTVNLATGPSFRVDTKGLALGGSTTNFVSGTDTAALHLGQSVAIHVKAFTAANGTTAAIANSVDTVTLRWSRFTATPTGALTASLININTLPGYFLFTPTAAFEVQIFSGIQGQGTNVTNLDGILDGNPPTTTPPIGVRALFIEDPGDTLAPAFFAGKVRQH